MTKGPMMGRVVRWVVVRVGVCGLLLFVDGREGDLAGSEMCLVGEGCAASGLGERVQRRDDRGRGRGE